MSKKKVHTYAARCSWRGATGVGYERYDRTHTAGAEPAEQTLTLASDPAFRGNPALLNPEQLVVVSASSCQLLSFLAVAARAKIDVVAYADEATAVMDENETPIRLNRIHLRPTIDVVSGPSEARVRELVQQAHEECYIANSLRTEVLVEPTIRFVDG